MPSSKSDKKFLKELKRKEMKRKKQKEKKKSKRRSFSQMPVILLQPSARSRSSSESSSGNESDMDLGKELHSIGHYINDKEEMIRQVFSVIKGKKLRAMLPPFLADLDVEDVKALCLEQLMGMSKQRIRLTFYIPCIYAEVEMSCYNSGMCWRARRWRTAVTLMRKVMTRLERLKKTKNRKTLGMTRVAEVVKREMMEKRKLRSSQL